ncbi:signal peptide peptidase SppA [Alsobacter soli]|uniref:Signal peptide peptidase SppA n=1 Tax=Alsobacter soli TaxID=2109933 RepID=A0A2T1HR06_9HYPH|nr:signal peptide peptidase SppA [Alsobacter soli]PSC04076.1 signal peptide peptidase SppA [Alsobacter soli]
MSSETDYLVDRRRLKRRVTFWRVMAFVAVLLAVVGAAVAVAGRNMGGVGIPQVARVQITGLITGDRKTIDLLKRVQKASAVKAVLLTINSPGGTVSGSEEVYDAIRELAGAKPTVAVVDGLAASGAYIAALGTDRIIARQTAMVGSIGVLFQYPNVVKLMDTVGVKMETIKSAPLKASPNPFEPTTPAAQAAVEALIADTYGWFKNLVAERRGIDAQGLANVSDGRVFTGRQALPLKLVDQIGGEKDAVAWLETQKNVAKNLPIRDWKPRDGSPFGLWSAAASLAGAFGFEDVAAVLRAAERSAQSPVLDGLLAVWQPRG